MAFLEIPIRADIPSYDFQISLDGRNYTLSFRFNERMGAWVLDIGDEEGDPILCGIQVVTGLPLIGRFVNEKLPPGDFVLVDEEGKETVADRQNFGNNLKLIYIEEASLV